jgi:hypothetical protein
VTLAATDNAGGSGVSEIVYTTDGSDPTQTNGTVYSSAFSVSSTTTVKYRAYDKTGNAQAVQTQAIQIQQPAPPPVLGSSYDRTVLNDSPVAFWDMSSTGSTESDLSGHNNTGTYKGGLPTAATMLNGDRAQDFTTGKYLTIPSNASFSISATKQLTWEGWIRPDTLQFSSNYTDWMGKCQVYDGQCEWESRMYSTTNSEGRCNRLSAYVFGLSDYYGSASDWQPQCGLLRAGQWLYVVGEYDLTTTPSVCGTKTSYPGTIHIWVNGIEAKWDPPTGCMSQYSTVPQAGPSPVDIGTMALDKWFAGAIGKVAIYNYLLTNAQISEHFTAMTGAQPSGSCGDPQVAGTYSCMIPVPTP